MVEASLGRLRKLIPSVAPNKNNPVPEDEAKGEDNSRGEVVSKKQHDVLAQLSITPQTMLDAQVLTPTKVKRVGFHISESEGYSFKEVEDYHSDVTKSIEWYANKLYERDRDVHKLATEVDKYITDYQNMKLDIELLEAENTARETMGDESEQLQRLQETIDRLERENRSLKSKNELLNSQLTEKASQDTKEENTVPTNGPLTNAERQQFIALEAWAEEVNVLYDKMENDLAASQQKEEELEAQLEALSQQVANAPNAEALQAEIEGLQAQLSELQTSYEELTESYTQLQKYSEEMETYSEALQEQFETVTQDLAQTQAALEDALASQGEVYEEAEPEAEQEVEYEEPQPAVATRREPAPAPVAKEEPMPYRLPAGVTLDDL